MKQGVRKGFFVFFMLAVLCGAACGQSRLLERYNMSCLDLASGLPHNNVNHIFVDSQGFVWISSYGGGAVRYDGYTFMSPSFLSDKGVSKACKGFAEDKHHRLWITYDEGVLVMDMHTMGRTNPTFGKGDIGRFLMREAVKVYCDAKGGLWHVMRDSVFRYTFNSDGSVQHVSRCRYFGNTPDVSICDIEQNGTVWIGIDNGLYRLSEVGDRLERGSISPVMSQLRGIYVTDMLKRNNTVWITTNEGLFAYDLYQSTMSHYRHTSDEHSLSHNHATALALTHDHRLIVGTLRGLNVLNEESGNFSHWTSSSAECPMPSDFVHCLLIYGNQLWIGTETAGVVKLTPKPLVQRNYVHESNRPGSLSPNPVNAMYVAPDGTLWVGTVEGGLNAFRPETLGTKNASRADFVHWTAQNSGLSHNSVSVLEADSHGKLWIGTWGGGVNVIPLKQPAAVTHIDMPADLVSQTNYIGALAYDKYSDALWIGSNDGIFVYDLFTSKLSSPFQGSRDIRGCIGAHVDRKGRLWMGCLEGVCVIDLKTGKGADGNYRFRWLRHKLDRPDSPVVDKITCFCETKDGTLWLGSNGYGLYRLVEKTVGKDVAEERFEVLTTDDGLANNAVKGIVEDEVGRLWITTNNGLSVFDPHARTFINYREHDGLLSQRFYWNSALKGPDGAIYLGSMAGLMEIRGVNNDAVYPVHLTFTRLLVDNMDVTAAEGKVLDADISQATSIRLHESNKSFAISFSTLSYAGEVRGHYSYRMKGFENEWTVLKPGEHTVRYTSLKPGTYTFEVEYSDEVSAESHLISIKVEVTPYFWKSWWFLLLLLMSLVGVAVWFYRQRIAKLHRQEAEKLLMPIRKAMDESEDPKQLQSRIESILDTHEKLRKSYHRSIEADKQQASNTKTFIERATEIMEQNYMKSDFGIAEFADAMGMSRSLLSKRLNAEAGQSTGQFIRNYRLSVAKKMILENLANRNITEIAYQVGFNDPKYFTRCFTNRYGNSPSKYAEEDALVDE